MDAERIALERERSIRDFCVDVGPCPKFRTALVKGVDFTGQANMRPSGTQILEQLGLTWGTIDDGAKDGTVLIYVRAKELPKALLSIKSVQVVTVTSADIRLFSPVYSTVSDEKLKAETSRSYAHTTLLYSEAFGDDYDPLSASPSFTLIGGTDAVKASGGKVVYKSSAWSYYRWDTTAQPPADCSIEAYVKTSSSGWAEGVCGRQAASTTRYYCCLATTTLYLYSGNYTLLGSSAASAEGTIRLEMVGTAIKAYYNGTEGISVTNSAYASGWAGQEHYMNPAGYLDNLKLYILAAGHPAIKRFSGIPFTRQQSQGVQVW